MPEKVAGKQKTAGIVRGPYGTTAKEMKPIL